MEGINFLDIAHFCSGIYSLFLILIGTPLNLLCFYIFTRLVPNRQNPTIIIFAHLALIELLIPFTWNINYVVRELIWKFQKNNSFRNLEQKSLLICKLISFGAYFSLQCAAWLKTLATFTRCVTLHHHWSLNKWISKSSFTRKMIGMLIFLVFLINVPIFIVSSDKSFVIDHENRSFTRIKCYQSEFFRIWEIVHLLLYNFIPFTLMILFNVLLIRQVKISRERTQRAKLPSTSSLTSAPANRRSKSADGGRLTKTLTLITIFFILFTAPAAIFYIFFNYIKYNRDLITMTLSNLATTSHVTSFIIYWLTSADFQDATQALFFCRSSNNARSKVDENQMQRVNPQSPLLMRDQVQDEFKSKVASI